MTFDKLLATSATAALLISGAALAQQAPQPAPKSEPSATAPAPAATDAKGISFVPAQKGGEMLATELKGMDVRNSANEKIGDIADLVVDKQGKIVAVLVGSGGFLGIGQKQIGMPYDALRFSTAPEGKTVATVSITKEQLEGAPGFVTLKAKTDEERAARPAVQTAPNGTPPRKAPNSGG